MTVSPVGGYPYAPHMTIPSGEILIAYARYSTNEQDLTAQRLAEQDPDLEPDRSPRALPGPPPSGSFRSDLDVRAFFFERFEDAIP